MEQKIDTDWELARSMKAVGYSTRDIAKVFNISHETIRQHTLTTTCNLLSTKELCRLSGYSDAIVIDKLYRSGIITPVFDKHKGGTRRWWTLTTVNIIKGYRRCPLCGKPTAPGRREYCSPECLDIARAKSRRQTGRV